MVDDFEGEIGAGLLGLIIVVVPLKVVLAVALILVMVVLELFVTKMVCASGSVVADCVHPVTNVIALGAGMPLDTLPVTVSGGAIIVTLNAETGILTVLTVLGLLVVPAIVMYALVSIPFGVESGMAD